MADKKISQLTLITGANIADNDLFVITDTSAIETKAIRFDSFQSRFTTDFQAYVDAAQAAQAGAEAAEANTINLFDQFGDQYLGPKASDPTTDNDGDPLTDGDIYFNTTDNVLKFYTGTAWVAPEVVATTAASNALTSETNAANSASASASSATAASNSATAASISEANALTSANAAATSETNAANSTSAAATSASAAATSATSAATSETNTAAIYDNFDDRYLGPKSSEPSVDNDGDPLVTGALFFDTTAGFMKIWNGSAWATAFSNDVLLVANNLSDVANAATARTNLDVDQAGTALALAIALG